MFECLSPDAERRVVVRLVKEMGNNDVDILCRFWAPLRELAPLVDGDFVADPENEDYFPTNIVDGEGVRLRTIHGSKGLEFNNDILVGCTQGVWPPQKVADYDEEYRLLYVALGRAKRNLFITTGGSTSVLLCTKVGKGEFPCPSRHFATTKGILAEVKRG
jgi:superfamily I DNA/RNA helicase